MLTDLLHSAQKVALDVAASIHRHPGRLLSGLALLLVGATGGSYALVSLAPDDSQLAVRTVVETVQPLAIEPQRDLLAAQAMRLYRSDVSRSTDTADSLLRRLGVSDPAASAFLRSDRITQKNLLGRAGRSVQAEVDERGHLVSLAARWSPEDDGTFTRLTVLGAAGAWKSTLETLPLTSSTRMASGTIQSSLFAATDDARIPDGVAVQMAEIFSGDIDFHRALRKGDRFVVVYETLEGDGEPLRSGRVLSTEFVNAGKSFQALWFQNPQSGSTSQAKV